jgi:hypothetical protein
MAELDIDLVVASAVSRRFLDHEATESIVTAVTEEKKVFIIPAFDVAPGVERASWADALVSFDKV